MNSETTYVIGVDFGTDSCRALVVDTRDGRAVASSVCYYPRWKAGRYCDPRSDRYRQHPLDYVESFETVVRDALRKAGPEVAAAVRGLSFDTTASTPVLVDRDGTPLALTPGFEECPDAMFVLWKDHTAKCEADEINALAARWKTDYTAFSGGTYSAEWAWAKVLHILRTNPAVAAAAWSWVEHCDWMSGLVTGNTRPETILRSRCAAGHKAMWRAEWGGLPDGGFLAELDPRLAAMRERLYAETFTADACAGTIAPAFAERLGIPADTKVGVGSIDAHVGAVGASIAPNVLTRIIGTSTCDILVCDPAEVKETPVRGICGQVDGSVVPGLIGFGAGQSAFGDLYAWFRNLLMWTTEAFDPEHADAFADRVIPRLSDEAAAIPAGESAVLALDWMNGRRTPDADQRLTGAICGLTLGTSAPMIFRALVEATAYGSKAIVDRFADEGVAIRSIIAIGGISQKSPFVMQTLADVLGMPIEVVDTDQACALGAAMFAAVAAGLHPDVAAAQRAMGAGRGRRYQPDADRHALYTTLYARYRKLGDAVERL